MPPHNDNNNNSQENSNNDKNSKNMASESSETLPALEEQGDSKLVPPPPTIQTENSRDDSVDTLNDNLGDISLTPVASVDIQNNDSADGNGNGDDDDDDDDVVVVDPWAQVAPSTATATAADGESTAVAEGEGDATATDVVEKKTLGERWGSFRNRWEQQWEAKKNAATPYTSNPDEPATAAISPPNNMDDDVTEDDTNANNKAANTNASAPATGPFARFRSGAGANPKKAATVVTDPSQVLSAEDMASFRASRISMTLQKDSQDSKWGFGMEQEPPASQKGGKFRGRGNGKSDKVRIAVMAGMGLLEHAPFQVGDTLVSVNNQKCTHAETTIQELVKMEGGSLVTLVVETPQGNPNLVQAMVRKPSNKKEGDDAADDSNNLGIGFYTPAALAAEEDAKKEAEAAAADEKGEEEAKSEITAEDKESTMDDDEEAAKKPPVDKPAAASAAVADDPTSKLLRINHIDANGLLAQSVLSQGDIVVAINATPCSQMTPEQAMELLEQSTDSVTIIAMKPPAEATSRLQRWKKHARRAGIAIGGGTMVGVGLIFIPTLPPPFGEVLIVGGVSVLGTEFEAPKRVMRSARDSLERAVGREGEPLKIQDAPSPAAEGEEGADGASETASTTTPTTTTDTDGEATLSEETAAGAAAVAPPKKTMGTRFKSFGRNFVLPFLDQVVGDRKEETKKEEESPSSPTAANPVNESTTNTEAAEEETAASVTTAISETSVVGPDPEESSIPNATPTTTDEGETAVSSSSSSS